MTVVPFATGDQVVHGLRFDVAFDTPGIDAGLLAGRIPHNSVIVAFAVDVTTAFNAVTTNVLTVGTTKASANELLDASALAAGTAGSQLLQPIAAAALARTAVTDIWVKYTQTGTAADAGAATIVMLFVPNVPASVPSTSSL